MLNIWRVSRQYARKSRVKADEEDYRKVRADTVAVGPSRQVGNERLAGCSNVTAVELTIVLSGLSKCILGSPSSSCYNLVPCWASVHKYPVANQRNKDAIVLTCSVGNIDACSKQTRSVTIWSRYVYARDLRRLSLSA